MLIQPSQLERSNHKIYVRATSHQGINIRIPRDFVGIIRHKSLWASTVNFSPSVHAQVVSFSSVKGESRSFLGDISTAGYIDGTQWEGDELDLKSNHGTVKIWFVDEVDLSKPRSLPGLASQSMLKTLFGVFK
jgi:hypothetical protein